MNNTHTVNTLYGNKYDTVHVYICLVTGQVPVHVLLSRPEMVYPASQVQWVVPCTIEQREGRTKGPVVAAGKVAAAAALTVEVAAEVFAMVTKTEWGRQIKNKQL